MSGRARPGSGNWQAHARIHKECVKPSASDRVGWSQRCAPRQLATNTQPLFRRIWGPRVGHHGSRTSRARQRASPSPDHAPVGAAACQAAGLCDGRGGAAATHLVQHEKAHACLSCIHEELVGVHDHLDVACKGFRLRGPRRLVEIDEKSPVPSRIKAKAVSQQAATWVPSRTRRTRSSARESGRRSLEVSSPVLIPAPPSPRQRHNYSR